MAAIAAAVIAAAGTAYAADQQNSSSLMGQAGAGQKKGGGMGGSDFTPSANQFQKQKFSPGISGVGDGSMPVKADSPGMGLGMQPQLEGQVAGSPGSVFSPQADFRTPEPTTPAPQAAPQQPPPSSTQQTIQDAGQYAQLGMNLAQTLQGAPLQPGPVAQVGGQGYQPTAMQAIQAMAARKRQMGY